MQKKIMGEILSLYIHKNSAKSEQIEQSLLEGGGEGHYASIIGISWRLPP